MRVLFSVWNYPSPLEPGEGVFHRTAAQALQRSGIEVDVVAPIPWLPAPLRHLRPKSALQSASEGGVRIRRPAYLRMPRPFHLRTCAWAMERAIWKSIDRKPDLVHSHGAYPLGLVGARVARRLGVPSVLTVHGGDVNDLERFPAWMRTQTLRALRESNCVVAVSDALALRTSNVSGRDVRYLPIGIDLTPYEHGIEKTKARQKLNLPADRRIVLYVGHLLPRKGTREFLAAVHALRTEGVLGIAIGDGPLRSETADGCLAMGPLSNERVRDYLRAADVFLLPSYSEGMPTVLIEAAAAGLPVISTAVGGVPNLLAHDRGLLIAPESVPDAVAAIRATLAEPEVAMARADRLRSHIHVHFDADRNARELAELYQQLLGTVNPVASVVQPVPGSVH